MKVYQVTQETPISNKMIEELNAAVLSATFKNKEGIKKADLYSCGNLVSHNTCAPINSTFVKTILIQF